MTVRINPGSGRITTGSYPSSYGYFIAHDTSAGESVTITTAAASPRIDSIVAYVDKAVAGSTGSTNNSNNVLKFVAVAGTPAGSPVAPTATQIQTAIGSTNPYIVLANVAVAASATTITSPNIADVRTMIFVGQGVVRQNDTTNLPAKNPRRRTGWGAITVPSNGLAFSEPVTFDTPFNSIPIVTVTFGGDQVSGTVALGNGGNSVQGQASAKAYGVTAAGFTAYVWANANWSTGNILYYHWTAED